MRFIRATGSSPSVPRSPRRSRRRARFRRSSGRGDPGHGGQDRSSAPDAGSRRTDRSGRGGPVEDSMRPAGWPARSVIRSWSRRRPGRWQGMRLVRQPESSQRPSRRPGRRHSSRSATRESTWRSSSSGPGTSRSRCWPTPSVPSTWASGSARSSGGTRSWLRSRPRRRSRRNCASDGGGRGLRGPGGGLSRRGHLRVSADRGRLLLFPGDEHPDPGRAPGDRAGLRGRSGAGAAPNCRRAAHADPSGRLTPRGWAIECRITSEDPRTDSCLRPAGSNISGSPAGPGVRWDSGVEIGDEVTLYYDSLLAKLIVWAPDRAQAVSG